MIRQTTENLLEIEADITTELYNLKELTRLVKDVDEEFMESPSDETKEQLFETIEAYKKSVDKVRILLEAYFQQEREDGVPADLVYRQLYKKLGEAY